MSAAFPDYPEKDARRASIASRRASVVDPRRASFTSPRRRPESEVFLSEEDDDNESFASFPAEGSEVNSSPKRLSRQSLLASPKRLPHLTLSDATDRSIRPHKASSPSTSPSWSAKDAVPGVSDPQRRMSRVDMTLDRNSLGLHRQRSPQQQPSDRPQSPLHQSSSPPTTPRRVRSGSFAGVQYATNLRESPTPTGKLLGSHQYHPAQHPDSPTRPFATLPQSPLRRALQLDEQDSLEAPSLRIRSSLHGAQAVGRHAGDGGGRQYKAETDSTTRALFDHDHEPRTVRPRASTSAQATSPPQVAATAARRARAETSAHLTSPQPAPGREHDGSSPTKRPDGPASPSPSLSLPPPIQLPTGTAQQAGVLARSPSSPQSAAALHRARAGSLHVNSSQHLSVRMRSGSNALRSPSPRLVPVSEMNDLSRSPSPWALSDLRGDASPLSVTSDLSTDDQVARDAARDEMQSIFTALRQCEPGDLASKVQHASQLRSLLARPTARRVVRSEFSDAGGFLVLVQMLSTLSENGDEEKSASSESDSARIDILALTLAILHECLDKHAVNQKFFDRQIGWRDLQSLLSLTGLIETFPRQFFALLLGFAVGKVFESIDKLPDVQDETWDDIASLQAQMTDAHWDSTISHAGILLTIVWLLRADKVGEDTQTAVLCVMQYLATADKRNQCSMVDIKLSSAILEAKWPITTPAGKISHALLETLYQLGVPVYDGRKLMRRLDAHMSTQTLEMLCKVAGPSSEPSSVTFDMRQHGYSTMVMAALRRPFPPPMPMPGFTFFATVRIDADDAANPIDILHIFDPQRVCFVRLSIDPADGALVYTSRRGAPSIRLANVRLLFGQWYHICLTHMRPRDATTRSRVRLHINGTVVDEQTTAWPESALVNSPVRAMFGTPPLEAGLQGVLPKNNAIWSIGPAYLLDDVLSPELPLVLSDLALSGYSGNFQDSLGRFLTYSTSTRINVALDMIAKQDGQSQENVADNALVHAITGPSRKIIREDKLVLVLNPANTSSLSRVIGSRSLASRRQSIVNRDNIFDARVGPAQDIVLNQAVALTREAMDMNYGYAKLYGDPILTIPYPLADTVWRLGGCALLLRLVERADEQASLERAVELFLSLVTSSWRLSEDVEQSKGYEILNSLLSQKKHLLSARILQLLCDAVGLDLQHKENWSQAALTNPFLYRTMLLDFTLWQWASADVQIAHLDQLDAFMRSSQLKRFNAKRVTKMQIARKILFALELRSTDSLASDTGARLTSHYISTLRNVLISSFNDAAIRAASSFLAAQLCKKSAKNANARPPNPRRQHTMAIGSNVSATFGTQSSDSSMTKDLADGRLSTMREIAIEILQMMTELVLDRPAFLLKLGSAINVKWLLVFFGPDSDSRAAYLSLDILTSLLAREPRYAERLVRSGGVKFMERLLPRYWAAPGVLGLCWASIFGLHSRQIPKEHRQSTLAYLKAEIGKSSDDVAIVRPIMLRVVLACLSEALHDISARKSLRDDRRRPRPSEAQETPSPDKKRHHARQRSRSVNFDARDFAADLRVEAQVDLVRENVDIIEKLTQLSKSFRELLFAPSNLRIFVDTITAHVETTTPSANPFLSPSLTDNPAKAISKRLLDVLALAAVEGMTAGGSSKGVDAILDAIPPYVDLSTATSFRLAFYDCVAVAIKDIVVPGLGDVLERESCQAIASFIEQSSGEVQSDSILALVAALLEATAPRRYPDVVASLLTSLDRIILFRLAQGSTEVYHGIIEYAAAVFSAQNQDTAFFHCLLHNVLKAIHGDKGKDFDEAQIASYNVLMLMASAFPELIESVIVPQKTLRDLADADGMDEAASHLMGVDKDSVPFADEWQGFMKSNDSLKAAIHLDRMSRIKLSLDKSDERHKAITQTESRMMAWQNSVLSAEETRISKYRTDVREMAYFSRRQWQTVLYPTLKNQRAVLGDSKPRSFELDPTEGPLRMRAKLKEVHQIDAPDNPKNVFEAQSFDMSREPSTSESSEEKSRPESFAQGIGDVTDELEQGETTTMSEDATNTKDSSTSVTLPEDAADTHDDKYRRVIRSLEKGDVIEGVENSLRVVFIECRASLLIFGKRCFYIVDDYFQRPDGELCNLWEAPEEERDTIVMSTLGTNTSQGKDKKGGSQSAMTLVRQLEGDAHQTRRWNWSELRLVTQKTFLHRKTAVEISFHDGQTCLLVLASTDQADAVFQSLASRNRVAIQAFDALLSNVRIGGSAISQPSSNNASAQSKSNGNAGKGLFKLADAVLGRTTGAITQRWIERKISNFDYLMCLNTAAGRTYQDITQYPIMPFILRDYNSKSLDLDDPASFRDLSLPMGAQSDWRRKQFQDRYAQLAEMHQFDSDNATPFHYGTHYSTAATVSGFLIRLQPFDKIVKALQGGNFDLADRLFSSIGQAYSSASAGSLGDVRELIPEAFYLPEFLVNSNNFDFGETQSGQKVGDVELPPWARGDPKIFIELHRQALESDYVSQNLHLWIDLIFGFKQRGEAAVAATNVFHELSYEDGLDLYSFDSPVERQAALKTVHMFGVCPRQIFQAPHPQRQPRAPLRPTLRHTPWLLVQSALPSRTLKASNVQFIYTAEDGSRPFASPKDYLILAHYGLSISTGHLDNSIRFYSKENLNNVKSAIEMVLPERVSCIVDASEHGGSSLGGLSDLQTVSKNARVHLGGLGGTVIACQVDVARRDMTLIHASRGHSDAIMCLDYSHVWSLSVSGSQDTTAIIWDAEGRHVKTLEHDGPVQAVRVCSRNGVIATASGKMLHLWSVNGEHIASVVTSVQDPITCLAFSDENDGVEANVERKSHEGAVASLGYVMTGHRGRVVMWRCRADSDHISKRGSQWTLEPFHLLMHRQEDVRSDATPSTPSRPLPLITALKVRGNRVITGDEFGKLYTWSLPGDAPFIDVAASSRPQLAGMCMQCTRKFGVFEKRVPCGSCGGTYCGSCALSLAGSPFGAHRFCTSCRDVLALHVGHWAELASQHDSALREAI